MKQAIQLFGYVCVLGLVLLFAIPISAQDATGRVIGSVADPQGGAVPGAKVTVTNVATRLNSTTTTREDGSFEVLNLPIGRYSVAVEREGFNKVVTQENKLEINQSLRFDITLTLGAVNQSVTVEAQTSRVETVSPTVSATVTGEAIQQAPLNGRNVLNLALLAPGVTESNPDNTGAGNYSIAGGRADSVTFLMDGSLNNDLLDNGVVFNPNPDTIEEFRVLESNYSAEYGRNGGGIISEVTKSGTNQWHGSAFDYLRNGDLDANSFFRNLDGTARDPLRRNQYGGTFGGPISIPQVVNGRDRFFFFVGYQGQKESDLATPTLSSIPVLSTTEAKGDFSQAGPKGGPDPNVTCFLTGFWQNTGNPMEPDGSSCGTPANPFYAAPVQPAACSAFACALDSTKFNPVSLNYVTKGLLPVTPSGSISPTSSSINNQNELTMRFDFQVTQKDQLTATIGGQRNPQLNPFVTQANLVPWADVPGYAVSSNTNDYFVNLAYTRTISSNMLNEVRFGTQRLFELQGVPVGPNAQFTASALGFAPSFKPDNPSGPPLLAFDNQETTIGYTFSGPTTLVNNTFGISDTFTWIRGKHNWKMGTGFSGYQNNQLFDFITNGVYDFNGTLTGNAFADFLLGAPTDFQQSPAAPSDIRSKSTYGFFQDEWHATKHFTLSLGIRYEYSSPKYDTGGRTFSIIPGEQSERFPNAPVGLVFPGDKGAPNGVNLPVTKNWAPRFGFAWDPQANGKTSVRGGFGIFYDILKAEDNFQFNGQPPFFGASFIGTANTAAPSNCGEFPTMLSGNNCATSNQSGQVLTFFSDPYGSTSSPNPFPSSPPTSSLNFADAGFLPFGGGSAFFVDPHLHTPYTYQYNLSVQHEIAPTLVFEADYIGSSSHGLTSLQDVNPFVLGTTDRVLNLTPGNSSCQDASGNSTSGQTPDATCSFGSIDEFRNIVNANYNAMTASLTKRMGNTRLGNVYFTFGYTYSHNIDNASGFRQRSSVVPTYQPELLRASSDIDVRNRVTFSGGWDLPFDRAWSSGPKRLTQGWTLFPILTWRSGFPLSIFANFPNETSSDSFAEGPSGAGDPGAVNANVVGPTNRFNPHHPLAVNGTSLVSCQVAGSTLCGNYWFNPTSFSNAQCGDANNTPPPPCTPGPSIFPSAAQVVADPALATYGTFRRNSLPGPDLVNLDMSISKTTAITERLKLEIRGDFFNILNHTEFANPDTNIQDQGFTFGQILNTGVAGDERQRIIQLGARFSF